MAKWVPYPAEDRPLRERLEAPMSSITRKQALDLIERAAATAVQAFLATWVVGDLGSLKAAGVAAAAAALAVVKGWAARVLPIGDDSASLV